MNTSEESFLKRRTVVLAGATGNLGSKIASYLLQNGAVVRALVRVGTTSNAIGMLRQEGALIVEVDYDNPAHLMEAFSGASCIISALNGLEDVIFHAQAKLLAGAIEAGVPRFIPSDYCIDYTKLPDGSNRNLDLRRRFCAHIDGAPIKATSVLSGMFTDLLTGEAPVILFGLKRVLYWGSREQFLDFTTVDNTAEYTARVALDDTSPRFLRVGGEVTNVNGLILAASRATGKDFSSFRLGGLSGLNTMIKITRALVPKREEIFPPWQGMQYLHNMFSGLPKLEPLDNERYQGIHWTSIEEVLATRSIPAVTRVRDEIS